VVTMVFSIITSPYWSAYTEAYIKKDFDWIKKTIRQLLLMWLVLVVGAVLMLLFSEYAYHLWVGDSIKIDFKLSLFMMLYTLIVSFGNIFIMVLNGIGRIRLQMLVNIVLMLVFIPLSYFLAVVLHLGIIGIVLSTIFCSLYGPLIAPLQVRKMLQEENQING
jgi:Na+-driven multidrug efflux pump